MAIQIPGIGSANAIIMPERSSAKPDVLKGAAWLDKGSAVSHLDIHVQDHATELVLKRAMDRINEMFSPYLGDGAVQQAVDAGIDTSPEATAERILSFASQLIGRVESGQVELPADQQASRAQLYENVRVGIERGFEDARAILDGLKALEGDVKENIDATYQYTQQGLAELATALNLA